MTNFEKLRTRIIIAKSIGISPDEVVILERGTDTFYLLEGFKGYNIAFGLSEDEFPTEEGIRECIKQMYLSAVEWDWDEEYSI